MSKCDNCDIMREMNECNELCACAWYIDNVVFGNKRVEDCTAFKEKKYTEGE